MKGDISSFIYVAFVVMLGIIGVFFVASRLSPVTSPEGRSLELATTTALYLDSLSTTEQGSVSIDMGNYKYDIEIQKKDSNWRTISKAILPDFLGKYIDKKAYYLAVTPYVNKTTDSGEEKGDSAAFILSTYGIDMDCSVLNLDSDCGKLLEGVKKVCIVKDKVKEFAEMVKCA